MHKKRVSTSNNLMHDLKFKPCFSIHGCTDFIYLNKYSLHEVQIPIHSQWYEYFRWLINITEMWLVPKQGL